MTARSLPEHEGSLRAWHVVIAFGLVTLLGGHHALRPSTWQYVEPRGIEPLTSCLQRQNTVTIVGGRGAPLIDALPGPSSRPVYAVRPVKAWQPSAKHPRKHPRAPHVHPGQWWAHRTCMDTYLPLATSPLLTTRQAAAFLGISPRTLEGWRNDPLRQSNVMGAPPCVRLGRGVHRVVRYRLSDLEAWVAQLVTV